MSLLLMTTRAYHANEQRTKGCCDELLGIGWRVPERGTRERCSRLPEIGEKLAICADFSRGKSNELKRLRLAPAVIARHFDGNAEAATRLRRGP